MSSIPLSAEDCYACVKMTKPCPYNHEETRSEPESDSDNDVEQVQNVNSNIAGLIYNMPKLQHFKDRTLEDGTRITTGYYRTYDEDFPRGPEGGYFHKTTSTDDGFLEELYSVHRSHDGPFVAKKIPYVLDCVSDEEIRLWPQHGDNGSGCKSCKGVKPTGCFCYVKPPKAAVYRFEVNETQFKEMFRDQHGKDATDDDFATFCEKFSEIDTCPLTESLFEDVNNIIADDLGEDSSDDESDDSETSDHSVAVNLKLDSY